MRRGQPLDKGPIPLVEKLFECIHDHAALISGVSIPANLSSTCGVPITIIHVEFLVVSITTYMWSSWLIP